MVAKEKKIQAELKKIFCSVLDKENLLLERTTIASDIEGWDSFNHIQLIVQVEVYFDIKFSISDIESFQSVGDLIDLIKTKLSV